MSYLLCRCRRMFRKGIIKSDRLIILCFTGAQSPGNRLQPCSPRRCFSCRSLPVLSLGTPPTGAAWTPDLFRLGTTKPSWAFSSIGACFPCPGSRASGSGGIGRVRNLQTRAASISCPRTIRLGSATRSLRRSSTQSSSTRAIGLTCSKLLAQSKLLLLLSRWQRPLSTLMLAECCQSQFYYHISYTCSTHILHEMTVLSTRAVISFKHYHTCLMFITLFTQICRPDSQTPRRLCQLGLARIMELELAGHRTTQGPGGRPGRGSAQQVGPPGF